MDYGFSVPVRFPLLFTSGVFDLGNRVFVDAVSRLEPARRHRVMVAVDDQMALATPSLLPRINAYARAHSSSLDLLGDPVPVAGGEHCKNDLRHTLDLVGEMNVAGLDRQSFIVAIGGGAVLDTVSFAAAITHRGVRVVRLPTTVLSQGDSGVGVKNGINYFGKKNFMGTFAAPFAVINDVQFLETLGLRDRIAGVSEAVKVALLKEPALFDYIEARAARIAAGDLEPLAALVRRSAELHLAHICGNGDPFELGSARPLDFGHWAAHKLESITHHRLRHGEAVAVGMALDITYAVRKGFLSADTARRIFKVIRAMGLPLWDDGLVERGPSGECLVIAGLREFREHLGGELHVTLLRDIGEAFEVTEMDEALVLESITELATQAAAHAN